MVERGACGIAYEEGNQNRLSSMMEPGKARAVGVSIWFDLNSVLSRDKRGEILISNGMDEVNGMDEMVAGLTNSSGYVVTSKAGPRLSS